MYLDKTEKIRSSFNPFSAFKQKISKKGAFIHLKLQRFMNMINPFWKNSTLSVASA